VDSPTHFGQPHGSIALGFALPVKGTAAFATGKADYYPGRACFIKRLQTLHALNQQPTKQAKPASEMS